MVRKTGCDAMLDALIFFCGINNGQEKARFPTKIKNAKGKKNNKKNHLFLCVEWSGVETVFSIS